MDKQTAAIIAAGISIACNLEAAALIIEAECTKKPRSCCIKPWRESRDPGGNIQLLLKEYKLYDDSKAYKSFNLMNEENFQEILNFVKHDIQRSDTAMRKCIPVEKKLAATLRFLATGETFAELAENTKLSRSYLGPAIIEVCNAIYTNMRRIFLKFPDSKEKWLQIANDFEKRWQFPLCLGALDGKHVAFTPSKEKADLFYNYKGFHSIVLLAMSDAYGKFLFIDVGCNGRVSDGGVLSRSNIMHIIENDYYLPAPKVIGNDRELPYVIVADNAFPNSKHILTPYNRSKLTKDKIIFNARLSRARQNIERAFGILSNRFRILQTKIHLDEKKSKTIVQACCVLHNFLIERSAWYASDMDIDMETQNENEQNGTQSNTFDRGAENIRSQFMEYFCNEGQQ